MYRFDFSAGESHFNFGSFHIFTISLCFTSVFLFRTEMTMKMFRFQKWSRTKLQLRIVFVFHIALLIDDDMVTLRSILIAIENISFNHHTLV